MAITATFNNASEAVTQLIKPLIIKATSTETSSNNFSYKVVVKLGSTVIFSSNYPPNAQDVVLADISNVVEFTLISDENAVFDLPLTSNNISANSDGGNIKYITVDVIEVFASAPGLTPTDGATSTINKAVLFSKTDSPSISIIDLVPRSPILGGFLTTSKRAIPMAIGEYKTLSFFFGNSTYTGGVGTFRYLFVDYYNAAGTLLESNRHDFGSAGVNPTSQAGANEFIKTFGVGAANLERMTDSEWKPSTHPTATYYEVYLGDAVTPTVISEKMRFDLNCKKGVTIKFVNQFGVWDYYTFRGANRIESNQTKETFRADSGNYQGDNYTETKSRRQLTDYNKKNEETLFVKTGFIDEITRDFLYELYNSPDVRLIRNDSEIPINSTLSSYNFESREFRSLIEIDFTFKFSRVKW